jgi:hypothetical protein
MDTGLVGRAALVTPGGPVGWKAGSSPDRPNPEFQVLQSNPTNPGFQVLQSSIYNPQFGVAS